MGYTIRILNARSKLLHELAGALFVDNAHLLQFSMSDKCLETFFYHVQSATIDWGKLLQAMGRILKQLKCYWHLLGFTSKMEKKNVDTPTATR